MEFIFSYTLFCFRSIESHEMVDKVDKKIASLYFRIILNVDRLKKSLHCLYRLHSLSTPVHMFIKVKFESVFFLSKNHLSSDFSMTYSTIECQQLDQYWSNQTSMKNFTSDVVLSKFI